MPVTKTAKRALRGSARKFIVNEKLRANLEKAIRAAKKSKTKKDIVKAISLADRAAKKSTIHANKAARIKSSLSKLAKTETSTSKAKKSSPKK